MHISFHLTFKSRKKKIGVKLWPNIIWKRIEFLQKFFNLLIASKKELKKKVNSLASRAKDKAKNDIRSNDRILGITYLDQIYKTT